MGEAEKRTLRRASDRRPMLQRVEAADPAIWLPSTVGYPPNFAAARSDEEESYPQKSGNLGNIGSGECRFEAVT